MSLTSTHAHILALARCGDLHAALNAVENALEAAPTSAVPLLALAYDISTAQNNGGRYLYQSRFFDFGIQPSDAVLDIGSGHIPFPLATALADLALADDTVGRAGVPFKHIEGKPVYECSVESTPFADKEFDFVYCSHVLEHVENPEAACRELMRIGKRGYIETPSRTKDLMFSTARQSNHRWAVSLENDVLVFTEYTAQDLDGLGTNVLLDMNCTPRNAREKAIAALEYVKPYQLNTMFMWEGSFDFTVRRCAQGAQQVVHPQRKLRGVAAPGAFSVGDYCKAVWNILCSRVDGFTFSVRHYAKTFLRTKR